MAKMPGLLIEAIIQNLQWKLFIIDPKTQRRSFYEGPKRNGQIQESDLFFEDFNQKI